jgi:NitT/TauT family transport system substrate-binding protein
MPAAPPHAPALSAPRPRRHVLAAVVTAAGLTALTACGTGTAPAPAGTPTGTHVSVAVVPITDAAPFILAVQRGYFTRAGLHVTYTITPQSTAAAADLLHGTVNVIAAANYVSFFAAQAHGALNIRILAANSQCGTNTQAVLALSGSGITHIQTLTTAAWVANLMQEGGMLTKPLNVAALVVR